MISHPLSSDLSWIPAQSKLESQMISHPLSSDPTHSAPAQRSSDASSGLNSSPAHMATSALDPLRNVRFKPWLAWGSGGDEISRMSQGSGHKRHSPPETSYTSTNMFLECLRQNPQRPTRHLYCIHICNHRIVEFVQCLRDQDTSASRHLNCSHNFNHYISEFAESLRDLDTSATHHLRRPTFRRTCSSKVLGKTNSGQFATCTV